VEAYATLIGILVGAGIFRVTSDATAATGPSVILAHLVLAPVILASSVAYVVFLSTPMGLRPGGEVLHIAHTLGSERLTFLAAWLKLISYLGAAAYLADALALNLLELLQPSGVHAGLARTLVALAMLLACLGVHLRGVAAFGRLQVGMCLVLGVSLLVLIVPGLFAIELANYRPFFTGGAAGFGAALPPLFFAYAGFEALSQAAGEVQDSRSRLPKIFVRGILATTVIFVAMSVVAFGVLPSEVVGASGVPMSAAAATYLPVGATAFVTLGAVMAVGTSLNATMLVPARLSWSLADEGRLPRAFARLHATRHTPVFGLIVSFAIVAVLLVSGRMGLALGIAVVALMILYALHSVALLLLPRRNPELFAQVTARVSRPLQLLAGWLSLVSLMALIALQFGDDVRLIRERFLAGAAVDFEPTSLELLLGWVILGLVVFAWGTKRQQAHSDAGAGVR
jgi:amino acid transporter